MKRSTSRPVAEDEAELSDARRSERSRRHARTQLIAAALCMLSFVTIALAAIITLQKLRPGDAGDSSKLDYNGLMYERLDDSDEMSKLGLSEPLAVTDCGSLLGVLSSQGALKGCSAYRLKDSESQALMLVNSNDSYKLYRFCYFSNAGQYKGQDILNVCGSDTELISIACFGIDRGSDTPKEWEKTLTDATSIKEFMQLFEPLNPRRNTSDVMPTIQQSDAWDAMATLKYKNGLTYTITLYNQLEIATGFRCVFDIPEEMVKLVGEK